jgi:hypothetical protein
VDGIGKREVVEAVPDGIEVAACDAGRYVGEGVIGGEEPGGSGV